MKHALDVSSASFAGPPAWWMRPAKFAEQDWRTR